MAADGPISLGLLYGRWVIGVALTTSARLSDARRYHRIRIGGVKKIVKKEALGKECRVARTTRRVYS